MACHPSSQQRCERHPGVVEQDRAYSHGPQTLYVRTEPSFGGFGFALAGNPFRAAAFLSKATIRSKALRRARRYVAAPPMTLKGASPTSDGARPALRTASGRVGRLRHCAGVGHWDRVVDSDHCRDEPHEDEGTVRMQQHITAILYAVETGCAPWPSFSTYDALVPEPIECRTMRFSFSFYPREDSPPDGLPFSCHLFPANAPQRPGSEHGGQQSRRHCPSTPCL